MDSLDEMILKHGCNGGVAAIYRDLVALGQNASPSRIFKRQSELYPNVMCYKCGKIAARNISRLRLDGWFFKHKGDNYHRYCSDCIPLNIRKKRKEGPREKRKYVRRTDVKVDKAEALKLLESGLTYKEVAERFNVTKQWIAILCPAGSFVRKCHACKCDLGMYEHRVCEQCKNLAKFNCMRDLCTCGRSKMKRSEACPKCHGKKIRKADYDDLAYLYSRGISGPCIAKYFKVTPAIVMIAVALKGIPITHNRKHISDEKMKELLDARERQ